MKQKSSPATPSVAELHYPSRKYRRILAGFGIVAGLEILAFVVFYLISPANNPFRLITDFHYVWNLLLDMVPPSFHLLFQSWRIWATMGETLSMAFLGTLSGAMIALVLCFLAARNTTPREWMRPVARNALACLRVAPDYAVMLIIVIAVGFGPFAGTIAIAFGSTGMFGKFFADAIEHVDAKQVEGVHLTGANRLQTIRFAILPQVLPSFVANLCFFFELNLGAAIALGAFGGGGLGFHLNIANDSLNYKDMFAYVLVILIMRIGIEALSDHMRRNLFHASGVLR
jgi:phosphonate transport system permease protein